MSSFLKWLLLVSVLSFGLGQPAKWDFPEKEVKSKQAKSQRAAKRVKGEALPPGAILRIGAARELEEEDNLAITAITFAQQGRLIISATHRTIRLWDACNGNPIRQLKDPGIYGGIIALSPDEKLVASGHAEATAIWELRTGKLVHKTAAPESWGQIAAFIDNKRLVSAGTQSSDERGVESSASILEANTGKVVRRVPLGKEDGRLVSARTISPDGRFLVSACELVGISGIGGYCAPVYLWDVTRGKRIRQIGGNDIAGRVVVFSADGKTLATASWNQPFQLWEVGTGKERYLVRKKEFDNIQCAAFSSNGRLFAAGNYEGRIRLWDLARDIATPVGSYNKDNLT